MNTTATALCERTLFLALFVTLIAVGAAVGQEPTPILPAAVIVTNPNILPPPGGTLGWVDHPCSKEVSYLADWTINGNHWIGTFALAKQIALTNIGTPQMSNNGNDVVTTFNATLHVGSTSILEGSPVNPPRSLDLQGSMTVRIKNKVGRTTGTFVLSLEAMTFNLEDYASVRQDVARPSSGWIAIKDLGNGSYEIASGLDVYSQIGMSDDVGNWYWAADINAPTHYELGQANCPPAGYPNADFTSLPGSPLSGQTVTFTDTSTGSPSSWSWDFGDGGSSAATNPTHVFASAGTYGVRLTVTNGTGSDSVGKLVTVASSPTWVPVVSHVDGKQKTHWRSDTGLLNLGDAQANYTLRYHVPGGGVMTGTGYVAPHSQSILVDVAGQIGVASGSGALEVVSDQPLKVSSRTYTRVEDGEACYPTGTLGQDYQAIPPGGGLSAGQWGWLPQLTENAAYRCNIGATNTGSQAANVTVTLYNAAGGVLNAFSIDLAPGDFIQDNQPFKNRAGQTAMDRGYAKVMVNTGAGVVPTASVIDNLTGDATTIVMVQ